VREEITKPVGKTVKLIVRAETCRTYLTGNIWMAPFNLFLP